MHSVGSGYDGFSNRFRSAHLHREPPVPSYINLTELSNGRLVLSGQLTRSPSGIHSMGRGPLQPVLPTVPVLSRNEKPFDQPSARLLSSSQGSGISCGLGAVSSHRRLREGKEGEGGEQYGTGHPDEDG